MRRRGYTSALLEQSYRRSRPLIIPRGSSSDQTGIGGVLEGPRGAALLLLDELLVDVDEDSSEVASCLVQGHHGYWRRLAPCVAQ